MKKGQSFFSMAMPHPVHRRMARLLSSFGPYGELPRSRWELTCEVVGRERAESLGFKRAKHLSERIIGSAERFGFISRLPSRRRTKYPAARDDRQHELVYCATPQGLAFRDRQLRFDAWYMDGMKIASRPGSDRGLARRWRKRKLGEMRRGR